MTSLPMPPGLSDPPLSGFALNQAAGVEADGMEEERHLLRAFRTFAETASSLEHSYSLLRAEVARLRRELEESHAGLARSVEENRSMRERLDRILESLPCGVVALSAEGEVTHLNTEARRLLALASGGEHSSAPRRLGDLGGELRGLLQAARMEGAERERRMPAASGAGPWLAVRRAGLAADGSGASVFIVQDVSERKRLEREQARHRRQQALAEMSAVLAHEVRNPLGSLELFAGLLAAADLDGPCRQWVGHLQHGLRTLAATVNNVLHFHGAPPPERAPLDLGQLLDWAAGFLAPLARRAQVELVLGNRLGRVILAADRPQLEQVLLNLALNALRVMPEGGSLELEGAVFRDPGDGAAFAAFSVSDSGPGIAPENLPHIFAPGFSTRAGSPGLGLAVCRKIVEQHGGTIQVAGRAPAGATFTVRFPLAGSSRESGRTS